MAGCLVAGLMSASLRRDRPPELDAATTYAPNGVVPTSTSHVGAEGADSPPAAGQLQAPAASKEPTASCDGTVLAAPANRDPGAAATRVAEFRGVTVSVSWLDPARGVITAGDLRDLPAWSTSKVPLSLAVLEAGQGGVRRATISAALRSSDNDAAEELWRVLGVDDVARAGAVTSVLRRAGDETTDVPTSQLYPPFSVFGQTQWTTADQVRFLSAMPCLEGAGQVIDDMASIVGSQRWGLGRLPGADFKGGWGPTRSGGYLVRQCGWYTDHSGARVLVAFAVQADSFTVGVEALNALAADLSLG